MIPHLGNSKRTGNFAPTNRWPGYAVLKPITLITFNISKLPNPKHYEIF